MANLKIKLIRSKAGRRDSQIKVVDALGLHKVGDVVVQPDNPAIRGMINKVDFMLEVEENQ